MPDSNVRWLVNQRAPLPIYLSYREINFFDPNRSKEHAELVTGPGTPDHMLT